MPAIMEPPPSLRAAVTSNAMLTISQSMAAVAKALGGSAADGAFTIKDTSELIEMALNQVIAGDPAKFDPTVVPTKAAKVIAELRKILDRLPTQTARDAESQALQQFSTPPHYAYLVAWVANLRASDVVLEPSAGTGSLVVHAMNAGCKVVSNEISERRLQILRALPGVRVFSENAEQLDVLLPQDVQPDVVLMNPPFSVSVNQPGRKIPAACIHIDQALLRLKEGGRLVAIMGRGAFSAWWADVRSKYTLRAIVGIPGKEYRKHGCAVDTQIAVIDKAGPTREDPVGFDAESIEDALARLRTVRDRRGERVVVKTRVNKAKDVGPGLFDFLGATNESNNAKYAGEGDNRTNTTHTTSCVGGTSQPIHHAADKILSASEQVQRREVPPLAIQTAAVTATARLTDAIFEPYHAQRLVIPGAQEHPTPLVQSAAMASVLPPEPTYRPRIPQELVESGTLSLAQLEAIVYAGQAHEQFLPGSDVRRGLMIGDSTGLGKGRELGGIILDNQHNGRRRAVWISKTGKLYRDAVRDWTDVGGLPDDMIDLGKIKASEPIPQRDGVLFVTYGLLKSEDRRGNRRMDQILAWLGENFDGPIGFDESHVMKSGFAKKGERGKTRVSDIATAGIELQEKRPSARVVYLSATGATEVANLAYAERLGLWGQGTAFPNKTEFINQVESGGVAAMELVALDMKASGVYLSRALSFSGVEYDRLVHPLNAEEQWLYNTFAKAWQTVLGQFEKAIEMLASYRKKDGTMTVDSKAKAAAASKFWSAHQRAFNSVLCSLQMPTVLKDITQQLAAGHCAVLQLVNTNEAAMERQLAKYSEEEESDLSDIDLTPRDQLLQLVEHCFPVVQHHEVSNSATGKTEMRPLIRDGKPVINPRAVAMRDKLLAEVASVRCPEGPLEMLINHFGPENVAEVTGRSRRVVRTVRDNHEETKIETRSPAKCLAEALEFQEGKRRILVFSDAGGTGASYHASKLCKNQSRRIHYLVQPGWVADQALQGFGRTHRSSQACSPLYRLVTTDLHGQRRFISSIARRLDQLGALTKGDRGASGQSLFSSADNLESPQAREALRTLYHDLYAGKIAGLSIKDFEKQTGLALVDKETGQLREELPPISRWLNRLLSLTVDRQNEIFALFDERIKAAVQKAIDDGTIDKGVEHIRAHSIQKVSDSVVATDTRSGALTRHVELKLSHKRNPVTYDMVISGSWEALRDKKLIGFYQNANSGKVYAFSECGERTRDGRSTACYYRISPTDREVFPVQHLSAYESYGPYGHRPKWKQISPLAAKPIWDKQVAEAGEFVHQTVHLLVGYILGIWDKLKGEPRVYRLQTDEGERLLGRVIDEDSLDATLLRLGVGSGPKSVTLADMLRKLEASTHVFVLGNGWRIKSATVRGERRIELIGPMYAHLPGLEKAGVFYEVLNFQGRFFIPAGERAEECLAALTAERPVVTVNRIGEAA